jgi:hypothetical protein
MFRVHFVPKPASDVRPAAPHLGVLISARFVADAFGQDFIARLDDFAWASVLEAPEGIARRFNFPTCVFVHDFSCASKPSRLVSPESSA